MASAQKPPGKAAKLVDSSRSVPKPVTQDPNAPTSDQVCGCPNTKLNAYVQNLIKLHHEAESETVVVGRKTLGPLAMAAIEAKREKRNPIRLVRFCDCHETVAGCHRLLVDHHSAHNLRVRTYCGGCNNFTRIPRYPTEHASAAFCGLAKPKPSSQRFGGRKKRYFMYMQSYELAPLQPLERKFWHW